MAKRMAKVELNLDIKVDPTDLLDNMDPDDVLAYLVDQQGEDWLAEMALRMARKEITEALADEAEMEAGV